MARTVVIMHRGRAAAAPSSGSNAVYYVAAVRGGRCDLELTFTNGVPQPPVPPQGRTLDEMNYSPGLAQNLSGGFGWNGDGALSVPFVQLIAGDTFETYSLGSVTGSALTGGFGWNGSPTLFPT